MKKLILFASSIVIMSSCVSKKKLTAAQAEYANFKASTESSLAKAKADLNDCDKTRASLEADLKSKDGDLQAKIKQLKSLEDQIDYLKKTNTNLLDRMSDLSIVSKAGAESIKKSLETLNDQSKYIKDLNSSVQRKDSLNLALVMTLKRSLADVNDDDVTVEVKKGVVYISISDKMLFQSGSAVINSKAETVLEKVAKVVNDHKELDILVEGHTDSVPIATDCLKDNWDLSTKRATSVVRLLQTKFSVAPERMTAGGRSEFAPKDSNENSAGRKLNRRTEIIVTPKLDQFFQLLANGQGK
ncbi:MULTISPECIES: OmpA/MotB family protein [Arcicella]|uniref:OmpA family protein n=2 Tax=Arcicella TaxID=217140 RepID=A0ABU5SLG3_9BACT|nr:MULTISPECIES: OmpA family protein [unclassified Arcicella]MEA5403694.1 OmpA family protein [Arcicella sp. DC2W]MEA5428148.1 OmpA family protein [Arcicella sp. DC25W]